MVHWQQAILYLAGVIMTIAGAYQHDTILAIVGCTVVIVCRIFDLELKMMVMNGELK